MAEYDFLQLEVHQSLSWTGETEIQPWKGNLLYIILKIHFMS